MKNNKNKRVVTGLRSFSWDIKPDEDKSQTENLIETTVTEWYKEKHRSASIEEIELINSKNMSTCPFCESALIVKNGKTKSGIQRYLCKNCEKKFTPLTNTIFEDRKIPLSEWIEYLLHLFEFHSIRTSAFDNRNASSTGKYWLIKVFRVLENIQDKVVLEDIVTIDETYVSVEKSKTVIRDGKKLRGISRNKIGIACGCDNHGRSLMIITGTSKPSAKSTMKAYGNHIKPGSRLIHDDENSHKELVTELNLISEVYPTAQTKKLKDEDNPLRSVNHLHSLVKLFLKAHGGYSRDDLQNWLNLFWFIMNGSNNKYDKVRDFLNLAINTPKKAKYREVMSKKSTK